MSHRALGPQFEHRQVAEGEEVFGADRMTLGVCTDKHSHEITAKLGDQIVGSMILHNDDSGASEVEHVGVLPAHQRKGIASALWRHAESIGLNPMHSDSQTPEGKAWADALDDTNYANNHCGGCGTKVKQHGLCRSCQQEI